MASTLGIGPIDVLRETQRMRERQQDRQPDLLNTLLQGIETGAKLENFPEQLRQQRLAQQLAVELQQAALQKTLRDLDPVYEEQKFQRELEKSAALYGMRPQLSTVTDPVTGAVSIIDKRLRTATPVTQSEGGGFSTGVKPTITELVDENTGVRHRVALNPDGSIAGTIGVSGLPQGNIIKDETTGAVTLVNPQLPPGSAPGQAIEVTTGNIPTGPSGTQPGASATGRKPFTVSPKPKTEKLPPTKVQEQYLGAQNLFQTSPRLEQKIADLKKAGVKEPSSFEKSVINLAYQDPKGLISGLAVAISTNQIRPEIAELEQIRAEIESNYTTSKAGLSQTASELKRVVPVAPSRFDSWDKMLSKTKNLREIAEINVANTNKQYPGFARTSTSGVQILDYPSEADVPDNLPVGTKITIGGRPAEVTAQ